MRAGDLVRIRDQGPRTRYSLKYSVDRIGMIIKEEPQRRFNRFYVLVDGNIIMVWELDLEKV